MSLLGDGYAWFVPTLVAGVPGVLIVLIILIQLLGGVIWTPSIRGLRSEPATKDYRSRLLGQLSRRVRYASPIGATTDQQAPVTAIVNNVRGNDI